ncbi:MAG: guanylate kinase [Bacillota bacterium]
MRHGLLFVVSGPSGAGKTALCRALVRSCPGLAFSVSATTRAPRPGEREGVDYIFLSRTEFEAKVARGEFLEWAEVFGHRYGTLREQILAMAESGRDVLLDIDVQGADQIRDSGQPAVSVFILPPRREVLTERIIRRGGGESQDQLVQRAREASREAACAQRYDYLIKNDDFYQALEGLRSIIIAERSRMSRCDPEFLAGFLQEV